MFDQTLSTLHVDTIPSIRMRRLRQHRTLRSMVRETQLTLNDLVLPLFIRHGKDFHKPIASMPGHAQMSVDLLAKEIKEISELGIPAVILFGIPEHKDEYGSGSYQHDGVIQSAIKTIKDLNPDLLVIADACFCEYTSHGHCGVVHQKKHGWDVNNDATLALLAKQAVSFADAGADVIAPSGMMDGMVKAIRYALDESQHLDIPILSYSTKFASGLYGPFREAAEGAPQFGDRSTYQMDPANGNEAVREAVLDLEEGADMLMVKPATYYLDVIYRTKQAIPGLPLAAYHVSGEFAMIKAAAANGWIDEKRVALEALTSIKRAGADIIINYFSKDVAKWLA